MTSSTCRRLADSPRIRVRLSIVAGMVVFLAGWSLAVVALLGIASSFPAFGWRQVTHLAMLCVGPQAAMLAAWRVRRLWRLHAATTQPSFERQVYGNLEAISDTEGRLLRPIGVAAADTARRTASLLGELLAVIPEVRIFHGVRTDDGPSAPVAHAVAAGRKVTLVESVAWPPGHYAIDGSGRISCDGRFIGQSIEQLSTAVRHWRRTLPRGHFVSAVIVVHRTASGDYILPATIGPDITWVDASGVLRLIQQSLGRQRFVSKHSVVALIAATPVA